MFTLVCSIFMNVMSMGFNLSKGETKQLHVKHLNINQHESNLKM